MRIRDAWLDFRNKCLTSTRFHQFAIQFPLTRPVVRKRQSKLFDIVSGFVYSQILFACVELNLFTFPKLTTGGASLEDLSDFTGLEHDEVRRLAEGAAALRLLEKHDQKFFLGDLGAALSINEGVQAMIRHHKEFYKDLMDPVSLLKNKKDKTHLSKYWDYAKSPNPKTVAKKNIEPYSKLMSASQQMVSEEVLATVDFRPFKKMMDLGGGQGTFLVNIGEAFNHLDLVLFDLPEVANLAKQSTKNSPAHSRMEFHGGSFFEGNLPKECDLVTLVRILHDHDDDKVKLLLDNVYEAIEPDCTLLICEPMSAGGYSKKISDAYFNFYLHAMGSGRPRQPQEIIFMLENAGFSNIRHLKTRSPFVTSIISAQK
ncbi:MAG: methyltransferase [Pseudomonadota bacterium]